VTRESNNFVRTVKCVILAKNRPLLGEAGVTGPLVEVLKTNLQSTEVMEQVCIDLGEIARDGE